MKKLLIILMLIPIVGFGQIKLWKAKDFHNIDSTQRISWHEGKIVAIMTYNDHSFAKGVELSKKDFYESINKNKSISITDQTIKEYIDYCYNDSTYVEYWQQPDYSNYQKTDNRGITTTLAIYIEPTLIKEYKHKEPTFIGFYEWLKTNTNK